MGAPTKPSDSSAWDLVYERTRPTLVRALTAATGTYDGVEDAIQDAFGDALGRPPPESANVEGRIFAAALERMHTHRRRARILRSLGLMTPARQYEIDRALHDADIRGVLNAPTPRERELLIAKHYLGMTQDEIAACMHVHRGAASAAMSDGPISADGLVPALEALPVPEEPTGLRATKPSLMRDPKMYLAAALLLVVAAMLTSPQFQHAAADLPRYVERIFVRPNWVGYYVERTAESSSGQPTFRLLVGSTESLRGPTTPDLVGFRPDHGQWSPDREHITISNDSQLYVGDRSGRLRPVADVGAGYIVVGSGWIGNDTVWANAVPMPSLTAPSESRPGPPVFVTLDLRTGALEPVIADYQGLPVSAISPDGRWLTLPAGSAGGPGGDNSCSGLAALYDRTTRETVDVVDGNGRPASLSSGYLSDGRIVVAQCDHVAHTMELYVGAPGARPTLIAVVPITIRYPMVTSDNGNDEILVIASGPDAPQSAYVFDPTGRLLRRVALPQFATHGTIEFYGALSHDGKSLGFTLSELHRDPFPDFVPRAGVVDLVTGQVTYLCDSGCFRLLVR